MNYIQVPESAKPIEERENETKLFSFLGPENVDPTLIEIFKILDAKGLSDKPDLCKAFFDLAMLALPEWLKIRSDSSAALPAGTEN